MFRLIQSYFLTDTPIGGAFNTVEEAQEHAEQYIPSLTWVPSNSGRVVSYAELTEGFFNIERIEGTPAT